MSAVSRKVVILSVLFFIESMMVFSQPTELAEYGFVVGDKCGRVLDSSIANEHLSIHLSFPERRTLCGKLHENTLTGTFDGQSYTMVFEISGRGKGFLNDGTELLMIKGSQTDGHELAQTLGSIGVLNKFHLKLQQEKVSYNEVIGAYVEKNASSIHLKLVLKTASVAQPGKRLILISFGLVNGEWNLVR